MHDPSSEPPVTIFGPDFPFDYEQWLNHPSGIGIIPESAQGTPVAIIGAGVAGIVAAYELMKLGFHPMVFEASHLGGRLKSQPFENAAEDMVAELGGMRFPISGKTFFHYIDKVGLESKPFPNPLTEAAGSTLIEIEGETFYAEKLTDLPEDFHKVAEAWEAALESAHFTEIQTAIAQKDTKTLKTLWNQLVRDWDERTFYDFIASSAAFSQLSFHHKEIFGIVGFGTGGWDSDFPNSMLEIFRVVMTNCDVDQKLIIGGSTQLVKRLWEQEPDSLNYWPQGTSLSSLHNGHHFPGITAISRNADHTFCLTDAYGNVKDFPMVLSTCQGWLLTTQISCDESIFDDKLWTAIDRTRYMQSSKTFVLVDKPFWKEKDPLTGRDLMSMTLTDRLTRGTYLFDNGPDRPAVICLTYSWMSDAMKMLPYTVEERVELSLNALEKIYPNINIRSHIISRPITVSWEADKHFLGAFKGALPGHYRYNERMYSHFMQQEFAPQHRGIFLAGDEISWTPGWVEGAIQTSLNAVWGIINHCGGHCFPDNPGPGDVYSELGPIRLDD